jgi:hypothetical protein
VTRRRLVLVLAVLLAVLADVAVGGCVSLPRTGPVQSSTVADPGDADTLVDYTPAGPRRGTAPVPLVDNFLTAMTATPLNTYVAREYLSDAASREWVPEHGTVAYGGVQVVDRGDGQVSVRLRDVVELDERGTWRGDPTHGRGLRYTFRLVKESGQWRILHPPDRLLIPRPQFDTQYQQYLLYFFDMSAQVLVPEPVYVPRGRQAPTLLVADLLRGPEPSLADVERSYVPPGTTLDGISVPVSRDGTAEIPLSHKVLDVSDRQLDRSLAQLAWTLAQLPGIRRLRVTVDGAPLDRPGGAGADVSVGEWSKLDPSVTWASTALFALRSDRVVVVGTHGEGDVGGPLADLGAPHRSVAVDLLAQRVAAVRADGRAVVQTTHEVTSGHPAGPDDLRVVYEGTDVLRPAYDLYGQLWLVDRTRSGARVVVVSGGTATGVVAPRVSGGDVREAVLSRDGSRLAVVVRRGGTDRVVVLRVRRDAAGRVRGLTGPLTLALSRSPSRVRDVAWRTASTLGVLVGPTAGISQVLVARVDGSDESGLDQEVEPFRGRAVRVLSAPAASVPLLLATSSGRLYSLTRRGWTPTPLPAGTTAPTFVG